MRKYFIVTILLICGMFATAQNVTPNTKLQLPPTGSTNWNIPLNYNFNRLDLMLSGNLPIPALTVTGPLIAPNFVLDASQVMAAIGYTPLNKAGDTMTGALNGTNANFSGKISGSNTNGILIGTATNYGGGDFGANFNAAVTNALVNPSNVGTVQPLGQIDIDPTLSPISYSTSILKPARVNLDCHGAVLNYTGASGFAIALTGSPDTTNVPGSIRNCIFEYNGSLAANVYTENTAVGLFVGGDPQSSWIAGATHTFNGVISDTLQHTQQVTSAGSCVSGLTRPTWNDTGGSTTDGTCTWFDLGVRYFSPGSRQIDTAGHLQIMIASTGANATGNPVAFVDGAAQPYGGLSTDGTLIWQDNGPWVPTVVTANGNRQEIINSTFTGFGKGEELGNHSYMLYHFNTVLTHNGINLADDIPVTIDAGEIYEYLGGHISGGYHANLLLSAYNTKEMRMADVSLDFPGNVTCTGIGVSHSCIQGIVATVTSYSITSNVLTLKIPTAVAPQQYIVGEQIALSGFPSSTFLNGQTVTLSTASNIYGAGAVYTASFTHADVGNTTETGLSTPLLGEYVANVQGTEMNFICSRCHFEQYNGAFFKTSQGSHAQHVTTDHSSFYIDSTGTGVTENLIVYGGNTSDYFAMLDPYMYIAHPVNQAWADNTLNTPNSITRIEGQHDLFGSGNAPLLETTVLNGSMPAWNANRSFDFSKGQGGTFSFRNIPTNGILLRPSNDTNTAIFAGVNAANSATKFALNADGSISIGSWKASVIAPIYGGTGAAITTTTTGNLICYSNTSGVQADCATVGVSAQAPSFSATSLGTTVNCSTSGSVIWSQPEQGSKYKHLGVYFNACTGNATVTFVAAFAHAGWIWGTPSLVSLSSASTSSLTITGGSGASGWVFVDGY